MYSTAHVVLHIHMHTLDLIERKYCNERMRARVSVRVKGVDRAIKTILGVSHITSTHSSPIPQETSYPYQTRALTHQTSIPDHSPSHAPAITVQQTKQGTGPVTDAPDEVPGRQSHVDI